MDEEMEVEAGGGIEIEDGTYEATCLSVEREQRDDWRGGPNFARFRFQLPLYTADGELVELNAYATANKLTPRTKLYRWYTALTGRKLEPGERIHFSDMAEKECLLRVENTVRDDGSTWAGITDVMPKPKQQQAAASSPNGTIAEQRTKVRDLLAINFGDVPEQVQWLKAQYPKAVKDDGLWLGGLTAQDCVAATKELSEMAGIAVEASS